MKNIAICLYGEHNKDLLKTKLHVRQKIPFAKIVFFEYFDPHSDNAMLSLHKVSIKKRSHEIEAMIDFDVCIAVNVSNTQDIPHLKIILKPEESTLYYIRGGFDAHHNTHISPDIFFADSMTFDRACEYALNEKHHKKENIRGSDEITSHHIFYHHLKSMFLKTVCVNYENSDLFKRAT